jgi:hypothetical protein
MLYKSNQTTKKNISAHYHVAVDVSYSMARELPSLKKYFKNLLASELREGDMLTIVWYSSKGECGHLLKDYKLSDIDALNKAQDAIDWLKPRNMTGFKDPLDLVASGISPNMENVLVFMSDGHENQNPKHSVIDSANLLASKLSHGLVVEFGDYANHDYLVELSKIFGGFAFAESSVKYESIVSDVISSGTLPKHKITVRGYSDEKHRSYVFYISNGIPLSEYHQGEEFLVPEGSDLYAYLGEFDLDPAKHPEYYAGIIYLALLNNDSVTAWDTLSHLGDIRLIDAFNRAIGKPAVNRFLALLSDYMKDTSLFFQEPRKPSYMPDENAYCLFDFIGDALQRGVKIYPYKPYFEYNRIGKKSVQASALLTEEKRRALSDAKDLREAQSILSDLYEFRARPKIKTPHDLKLVFNTSRANISFNIAEKVNVSLLQEGKERDLSIDSTTIKSYALLKDLTLNIPKLPVCLTPEDVEYFNGKIVLERVEELSSSDELDGRFLFIAYLYPLPMINRKMLSEIDPLRFFKSNKELLFTKYSIKVLKYLLNYGKEKKQKEGEPYAEYGITSDSFNPKMKVLGGEDSYNAPSIEAIFEKIGSIPTISAVVEKISLNKKLTQREQIVSDCLDKYEGKTSDELYEEFSRLNNAKGDLERDISNQIIALLIGRYDFSIDFPDGMEIDGVKINVEQKETEVLF